MNEELSLQEIKNEWHGTFRSYVIGFIASLFFTILSFALVIMKAFSSQVLVYIIAAFAIVQAIVQLRFFLHVGEEPKPRWETLIFCFMTLTLLIIVIGTLWIMSDLNARMMPPMDIHHD